MYDVCWFGGGEETDATPVAEETEVAVICHNVNGGVPRDLRRRRRAWTNVVDGANVTAVESEAGAGLEHVLVGWIC